MTASWTAGPVDVPGSVQYTLVTGDRPTDRWHVSVAVPPPELRADAEQPVAVMYLLDGFLTFTPTRATSRYLLGETPYGTGGAGAMLDLIREEVAPFVESAHSLDPDDRGLGGFSLGGLFTCWALVRRPEGFRRYLAVSPSLWWDDHLLLDGRRAPLADGAGGDVYLAVGGREDSPDHGWPVLPAALREALSGLDMVADLARFTARLRDESALDVRSEVIPDEQHATVWPAAVTRGLVHLYRDEP
ncbi:alpha/beta hydrolase-fold protein [Spirillospora sp. NPDC048832]